MSASGARMSETEGEKERFTQAQSQTFRLITFCVEFQ